MMNLIVLDAEELQINQPLVDVLRKISSSQVAIALIGITTENIESYKKKFVECGINEKTDITYMPTASDVTLTTVQQLNQYLIDFGITKDRVHVYSKSNDTLNDVMRAGFKNYHLVTDENTLVMQLEAPGSEPTRTESRDLSSLPEGSEIDTLPHSPPSSAAPQPSSALLPAGSSATTTGPQQTVSTAERYQSPSEVTVAYDSREPGNKQPTVDERERAGSNTQGKGVSSEDENDVVGEGIEEGATSSFTEVTLDGSQAEGHQTASPGTTPGALFTPPPSPGRKDKAVTIDLDGANDEHAPLLPGNADGIPGEEVRVSGPSNTCCCTVL